MRGMETEQLLYVHTESCSKSTLVISAITLPCMLPHCKHS